jgi:hypothetical protein
MTKIEVRMATHQPLRIPQRGRDPLAQLSLRDAADEKSLSRQRFAGNQLNLGTLEAQSIRKGQGERHIGLAFLGHLRDRNLERSAMLSADASSASARLRLHRQDDAFGMIRQLDHTSFPFALKRTRARGTRPRNR